MRFISPKYISVIIAIVIIVGVVVQPLLPNVSAKNEPPHTTDIAASASDD